MKLRYRLAQALGRMSWLRLGIRRRLVRSLAAHDTVPSQSFDAAHFAGRYQGDIANAQEWHVCFFGGYELKELALIKDLLGHIDDAVSLDIGGNLGGHALTMAQSSAQVHTVEPYPPLADRIEQLMALNERTNTVIHRVGLGDKESELDYFLDTESRNQGTGSFLPEHSGSGVAAKLAVVRGDDHFADTFRKLDFVKIDIEGFEAPALQGLSDTLAKFEPVIMMEVTESSAELFEQYGGVEKVIPFAFDVWKITNPKYVLGVFETARYAVSQSKTMQAGNASFNVLIVPHSRRDALRSFFSGL